jgi:hypothetical protein
MSKHEFEEVKDPKTEVFINDAGSISITQPEECCSECLEPRTAIVFMSAKRARLVAAALIELADQIQLIGRD